MPVFDWGKSDLDYTLEDGSKTLAYIQTDIPDDSQELLTKYKVQVIFLNCQYGNQNVYLILKGY